MSEALTKMMMRHTRDSNTDIVACVNCCAGAGGVLVDRISVKVPKNGNESAIILQTAQSRPPFDDQDNVIDFEIESREGDDVKANVVAAKNALLDSWAQFFTIKGLKLTAMDVDIFGLLNAYTATASEEDLKQTTAVINIGEKKMSIGFIQAGKFHSMRAMTGGSIDIIIAKLNDTLGIDAAKCHEIFETGDLSVVDGYMPKPKSNRPCRLRSKTSWRRWISVCATTLLRKIPNRSTRFCLAAAALPLRD